MLSSAEYERNLERFNEAVARIPELESLLAQAQGKIAEADATINRMESRMQILQAERDAAIERSVETQTGMRMVAAQIVAMAHGEQPHRLPAVEALISQAVAKATEKPAGSENDNSGAEHQAEKIAA